MIEINLDEISTITIEMQIDGNIESNKTEMRFSIINENIRHSFIGKRIDNGIYQIKFPKLLGKIDEGTYDAEIEILIGDKHFVPLTETVNLFKKIEPKVIIKKPDVVVESIPSVVIKQDIKQDKSPIFPIIERTDILTKR